MKLPQRLVLIFLSSIFLLLKGFAQNKPSEWKEGEDLYKKTARYLFLKVSVDKKEAFAGESIVAKYQLYVALDIQGQLAKAPSYRGFAAYDMQSADNESYTVEPVNGINYRVYLIKTAQLFGLKPGLQLLEPVELDATVQYRREKKYLSDNPGASRDTLFTYTAKSEPVGVNIMPLPPAPGNEKNGGVGVFEITAAISKPVIEANKSDTLTIIISGKGSWHEIVVPKIVWPEGLETFEPAIKETLDPLVIPVNGSRTLQYPIVVSKPGTYVIPPVKFTFFNPDKKQFTTLVTDSIAWTVTPATTRPGSDQAASSPQNITALFSKFAVVLFPLTALVLIVLVMYRKKKTQSETKEKDPKE